MKNAITVVDQELIDLIQEHVDIDVRPNIKPTKELLSMAKDLIEINAELTKREQKYKMAINDQIRCNMASTGNECTYMFLEQALKGDSDE